MEPTSEDLPKGSNGLPEAPDVYDELREASVTLKDFSELPPPPKEGLLPKYQAKPEKPVETRRSKKVAKHEKQPLLNMAAKLAILAGALAGCTGQRETIPATPVTAAEAAVVPKFETTNQQFAPGELSPENKQVLIQMTGLGELSKIKSIAFVDKVTSSSGKEVQILSIDGAKPFASTDQLIDTINDYESMAQEGRQVTARLEIDSSNSIDVPFTIHSNSTHNKLFLFGGNTFSISQAMPDTYGKWGQTYGITRDGSVLGLDTSTSIMTGSKGLKAATTDIDYAQTILGVETCQNIIDVKVSEEFKAQINNVVANNPALTENRINHLGQELICNAFGFAKAAKIEGKSYQQYVAANETLPTTFYAPLSVKQPVVNESIYNTNL